MNFMMKHCPRAVSIARPSTLQLTTLPSELAAAPHTLGEDGYHPLIVASMLNYQDITLHGRHVKLMYSELDRRMYLKVMNWISV